RSPACAERPHSFRGWRPHPRQWRYADSCDADSLGSGAIPTWQGGWVTPARASSAAAVLPGQQTRNYSLVWRGKAGSCDTECALGMAVRILPEFISTLPVLLPRRVLLHGLNAPHISSIPRSTPCCTSPSPSWGFWPLLPSPRLSSTPLPLAGSTPAPNSPPSKHNWPNPKRRSSSCSRTTPNCNWLSPSASVP